MTVADRWPRDLWLESIWEDETLRPNERVVAYVYARYAFEGDTAWASWTEVMRRSGIKSKNGVWLALRGLVAAGYLVQAAKPRQHRSAVYRLSGPPEGTLSSPPEGLLDARGPQGDLRGPPGDLRGPQIDMPELRRELKVENSQAASAESIIEQATGATSDESTAIAELIRREKAPKSLPGLVRHLAAAGELTEWLDRVRGERAQTAITTAAGLARRGGECQHGIVGGAEPHPDTGLPWFCALCRVHAKAAREGVKPATTDLRVAQALNLKEQPAGTRAKGHQPFRNPADVSAYYGDL